MVLTVLAMIELYEVAEGVREHLDPLGNTSTRPSSTSGYIIFKKKHMAHVLYQIFQEKSMEMVSVCQGFPSHAHQCRQRQPGQVLQVGTWYFQNTTEDLDFVSNIIQHAYNSKFCIL